MFKGSFISSLLFFSRFSSAILLTKSKQLKSDKYEDLIQWREREIVYNNNNNPNKFQRFTYDKPSNRHSYVKGIINYIE